MRTVSNFHSNSKAIFSASLVAAALSTGFARGAEAHEDGAEQGSNDQSKTVLALDLDFLASLREPGASFGAGGALRLGRKLDLILVSITPELGAGYASFRGEDDVKIYRGFIGGRLGVGKIIEPSVFSHIGVGRLDASIGSRTAPIFDAGVALDLTFLPLIDLGAHAGYNMVLPRGDYPSFDWLAFGLHAALVF